MSLVVIQSSLTSIVYNQEYVYEVDIGVYFLYFDDTVQMLKKGVRQCFHLSREILALCLGGMSFLIVEKKDFQLSQRWVMHYFSGV